MRSSRRSVNLKSFLLEKSDQTSIQLLRYTFVGAFAYVVDIGSLFFFTEYLRIHYLVSAALAFILGLITNYLLSIFWVFAKRSIQDCRVELMIFSIIGLVGVGINEFFIWFFTEITDFHYLISKLFSTGFVFFWNFFARKKMLFS